MMVSCLSGEALPLEFDGRTLNGWQVQGAPYWRVADGHLVGHSDAAKKPSQLWTRRKFRDFTFQAEYRISEGHDSGVLIRGFNDQIQIGTSPSLKCDVTGSPYIVSKRGYPVRAELSKDLVKIDDWNRLRIEVRGKHYRVWLNGVAVLDYESETASEEGPVGLQVHPGMAMTIEFRELQIDPLDDSDTD
jgi:hypothetical protein